jgi:iron only hydrogenase large subunit-like protein
MYHVTVMPCYDKKLEASRADFHDLTNNTREVDCVLSTGELSSMLKEDEASLQRLELAVLPSSMWNVSKDEWIGTRGNASGGYLEYLLERTAVEVFGMSAEQVPQHTHVKTLRSADYREITLERDGRVLLRFAAVYGFRNIQNLIRKLKMGKCTYHYVEVMACPSGCINGGGQIKAVDKQLQNEWINAMQEAYVQPVTRSPHDNTEALQLVDTWLAGWDTPQAQTALRTHYHAVDTLMPALATQW